MKTDITHREPNQQWGVASHPAKDGWEEANHYLVKGNGFKYNIVATFESVEEAEEVAIAMNYWETRPL